MDRFLILRRVQAVLQGTIRPSPFKFVWARVELVVPLEFSFDFHLHNLSFLTLREGSNGYSALKPVKHPN